MEKLLKERSQKKTVSKINYQKGIGNEGVVEKE